MQTVIFEELIKTTQSLLTWVSLIVAGLYLVTRSVWVRDFFVKEKYSVREKIGLILVFGFIGVLCSEYGISLIGVTVNVRDCIAIFAGILGGPAVGIGAGLISGLYRMTGLWWKGWTGTLGYWSAIGCGLATIGAGFLGAWLSKYKKITLRALTSKTITRVALLAFFWELIHLEVIVPLTSPFYTEKTTIWIATIFFKKVLLPMGLANFIGVFLFLWIGRDVVLTRRVETAKEVLEIRVKARTRELREQAEALRADNERKTRNLRRRLKELERFQKLTVGRELKMIELKKEIEKLKKELEKYESGQSEAGKGRA